MVKTKEMVQEFLTPKTIEKNFTSVEYKVEDNTLTLALADVEDLIDKTPGNAGISYGATGYATNKDRNFRYTPTRARGIGRDFGIYHQAFLESQAFQDGWGKIEQGLVTSHWFISPVKCEHPNHQEYAEKQAKAVEKVLFGIDGGWSKHIREALYMLIAGFAPFIRIVDGLGQLAALSFRYPSQVRRWLTDEYEQNYLGIEFDGQSAHTKPYEKLANELLVYQFRAIGNDFEGISPMRSVMVYIEALKLFMQLEGVAAEKYGSPFASVERPVDQYDKADDDALLDIIDNMLATDNAIILLPGGYKLTVSSPQGQMPNFESVKRYCDEKIATILSAEGSLIGLNGKGAYNLAEIKDDQQLRSLSYYARLICSTINDKSASGHESLIAFIVKNLTDVDGEDLSMLIHGELPQLSWALSPEQDDSDLQTIIELFKSGVLTKTDEDEAWLREKFKMPARKQAEPRTALAAPSVEVDADVTENAPATIVEATQEQSALVTE